MGTHFVVASQVGEDRTGFEALDSGPYGQGGSVLTNLECPQCRVQSVVNALVLKHAIGKERLTLLGISFAATVASNRTEEGRSKNQRVELV